jgi:WD40 repeat protein
LLASGGRALDNNIHVWNALSGTLEHAMLGPAVLTCLNFNPTGSRLAAVGYDGVVLLFDPYIGQEVLTLRGLTPHRPAERAVDSQVIFSPDGNKIAVNIWDGSICVFDATPLPSNKADFNRP